jgi:hypothetical protein
VKATYLETVVGELSRILPKNFTIDGIQHGYTLAGFMRDPWLVKPLVESWRQYASVEKYLPYLWAMLNSFTPADSDHLKDALSYWNRLTDKEKKFSAGRSLQSISGHLRNLNWEFSDEQLSVIIGLADESLQEIISHLLFYVDSPEAMRIVLAVEGKRDLKDEMRNDHWDERWDRTQTKRRLSPETRAFLEQAFSNREEPNARRYVAWRYWTGNVETETVMARLQQIEEDDRALFKRSVYWRVSRGDVTAFDSLTKIIVTKPWLVRMLDNIWSDEVSVYFNQWLDEAFSANDEHRIGYALELLGHLDNSDAEKILIERWDVFRKHESGIGAALFLSTTATRNLVAQEIRQLDLDSDKKLKEFYNRNLDGIYFSEEKPDPVSREKKEAARFMTGAFSHMHLHFFTNTKGKGERVTREKMEGLLPFMDYFDTLSLHQFASSCRRLGFEDLVDRMFPHFPKWLRHKFRLNEEDLFHDILVKYREVEKDGKVAISHWIDDLEKLDVSNDMVAAGLEQLWEMHQNGDAFFIASLILEKIGTRKEIPLLEKFASDERITGGQEEKYKIGYWLQNTVFSIKRRGLN